jgi:hypothetical protein
MPVALLICCIAIKRSGGVMGTSKRISDKGEVEITVTGIVIGSDWDEHGNLTVVSISTNDEQELIIDARRKKGRELQKCLRRKVQVTGRMVRDADDREMIRVSDFKVSEEVPLVAGEKGFVEFRI